MAAVASAIPKDEQARSLQALRAQILGWPVEVRAALAPLFAEDRIKADLRRARNDVLSRMAKEHQGSRNAIADKLHAELRRYAASADWRADRALGAPGMDRHALAYRALALNGGRVLSASAMRRLFVGKN